MGPGSYILNGLQAKAVNALQIYKATKTFNKVCNVAQLWHIHGTPFLYRLNSRHGDVRPRATQCEGANHFSHRLLSDVIKP